MQNTLTSPPLYFNKLEVPNTRPALLIHSALGTHNELEAMRARFSDRTTYVIDLPGHGKSPAQSAEMSSAKLGEILSQFVTLQGISEPDVIGYSLGGYVALELATLIPHHVRSVTCHATKFYWKSQDIAQSTMGLDANILKSRAEKYYLALQAMHTASGADQALRTVREIIGGFSSEQMSVEKIKRSAVPVLLTLGDSDDLISTQEVQELYQALGTEQASLAIFPNTRHDIRTLPLDLFELAQRTFWNAL